MTTMKRSGCCGEPCTSKRSNSRNNAHGPSKVIGVPPGWPVSLICDDSRAPGHCRLTGALLPGVKRLTWPSMSSVSSFRPSLSSSARTSTRKAGALPPLRKNTSRTRAARWKSASAVGDTGRLPSPVGRKLQGLVPTSTSALSLRVKKSSIMPPGAKN